jgi:hypothetical protein
MLLKFKITEDYQYNDWAISNIKNLKWDKFHYDPNDGENKFYFFRYVDIHNDPSDEPRFYPMFVRNYQFLDQAQEYVNYILKNPQEFIDKKLIPVLLDPLEGFHETTAVAEYVAESLKDICTVYFINGNNLLKETDNKFKFYSTNHWIHHLSDLNFPRVNLNETHKVYVSLNRMAREHRVILTSKLIENNLRDNGYITWANGRTHQYIDFTDNYPNIHQTEFDILDVENILEKNPTRQVPLKFCADTFLYLVTETHFDNQTIFLSEKSFKPIILGMPFINLGNPGTLALLKELGFKTFDKWIDESYDLDKSIEERCDIITNEINRLSEMTNVQRINIRKDMEEVLVHNIKTLNNHLGRSDLVESLMDIGKEIYTDRKRIL